MYQISLNSGSEADVKVDGDVVHILLDNSTPERVSLEYDAATNTYQPSATPISPVVFRT